MVIFNSYVKLPEGKHELTKINKSFNKKCKYVLKNSPKNDILVGGLEHFLFHVLGIIIPTDFHIFQRG